MLNTLKYAMAAVSTVIAGGYVAQQTEAAHSKPQAPIQFASYVTEQDLDRRVSVDIDGNFSDVLKWLKQQNVDFVIADESVGKRRISLHMHDKPLREAMDAVAKALGGEWERENDTYVFQSGPQGMLFNGDLPGLSEMKNFKWDVPPMVELKALPEFNKEFMKNFKLDDKDMQVWIDGKKMSMKDLEKDGRFKVFTGKDMKDFKIDGDGMQFWVDGKKMDLKELEKGGKFKVFSGDEMKDFMKEFKGVDGKEFKIYSDGKGDKDIRVWVNGKEVTPRELQGKGGTFIFGDGEMDAKTRKQVEDAMGRAKKELEMYRSKNGGKMFSDVQQKDMEAAMKEAREAMAQAGKTLNDPKVMAEIERARAQAMKDGKLSAAQRKEMEAAMKQAREAMAQARKQMNDPKIKAEIERARSQAAKEGKLSDTQRREIELEMKRAHDEMAKAHGEMDKAQVEMKKARLHGENMKKLLDSITPAQWELSKKQGYLKFSDLTPAQRKLIGDVEASDDMTLSYSIDGKKITIKGK